MSAIVLLALLDVGSVVMSACVKHNCADQFWNIDAVISPVAVIGEPDRLTEEEYARVHRLDLKEVRLKGAATVAVICSRGDYELFGNGSLIGTDDVLVVPGHVILGELKCIKEPTLHNCRIKYITESKTGVLELKTFSIDYSLIFKRGFECNGFEFFPRDDWAILKLDEPLHGVIPYTIIPNAEARLGVYADIVQISSQATDYGTIENGVFSYGPKHISECKVRKLLKKRGQFVRFEQDCDASHGASGASILAPNFKELERPHAPIFLGMLVSGNETEEQSAEAQRIGVPNRGEYISGKWATYSIPLKGDFLKYALDAMVNIYPKNDSNNLR